MGWMALTTRRGSAYSQEGLVAGPPLVSLPLDAEAEGLLSSGTLYVEVADSAGLQEVDLLDMQIARPWAMDVRLSVIPGDRIRFDLTHPGGTLSAELTLPGLSTGDATRITYVWDGPRRKARLSAYCPATDQLESVTLKNPAPWPMALVQRHALSPRMGAPVEVIGLASHRVPIGPLPGLPGELMVETTLGPKPMAMLRMGDCLPGPDGRPVPVLASVTHLLPGFGTLSPVLLRPTSAEGGAPQVVASQTQVLCDGPEVGYLTGEDQVLLPAAALQGGRIGNLTTPPAILPYTQLICTEPALIQVGTSALSTLRFGESSGALALRHATVIPTIPGVLTGHLENTIRVLKGYEATTLGSILAA